VSRPNILLLFTDQQRADTIHAAGNPVIRTPALDRLVREGVTFRSAYTPSPVCVSARCSLIFGQYPHRTGCSDNADPMPEDRPAFMDFLADAGYHAHGIGKMHFKPDSQALRGFHSREHQEEMRRNIEDDDYLRFLHANGFGHVHDPMGCRGEMYYIPQPAQMPAKFHATQWVGDRAVAFLRDARKDEPFFLWTSFVHPHPPFSPPTPWNKLYRAPMMPLPKRPEQLESLWTYMNRHQNRYKFRDNGIDNNLLRCMKAYYYACISFIDHQIGRILATLEQRGDLDNTLILFTSDHGEFLGDYNCFGKRSMLDPAARIPLLVRHPERFEGGTFSDAPVSLVDIMPTFLNAAGIDAGGHTLDGVDLADIARGGQDDRRLYAQHRGGETGQYRGLSREWKYAYSAADRREYLFDRVNDPQETRSRAGVRFCLDTQREMRNELIRYLRSTGYSEPCEGDNWRLLPQPEMPANPDAGLLIQDAPWAKPYQAITGYTDS